METFDGIKSLKSQKEILNSWRKFEMNLQKSLIQYQNERRDGSSIEGYCWF